MEQAQPSGADELASDLAGLSMEQREDTGGAHMSCLELALFFGKHHARRPLMRLLCTSAEEPAQRLRGVVRWFNASKGGLRCSVRRSSCSPEPEMDS